MTLVDPCDRKNVFKVCMIAQVGANVIWHFFLKNNHNFMEGLYIMILIESNTFHSFMPRQCTLCPRFVAQFKSVGWGVVILVYTII